MNHHSFCMHFAFCCQTSARNWWRRCFFLSVQPPSNISVIFRAEITVMGQWESTPPKHVLQNPPHLIYISPFIYFKPNHKKKSKARKLLRQTQCVNIEATVLTTCLFPSLPYFWQRCRKVCFNRSIIIKWFSCNMLCLLHLLFTNIFHISCSFIYSMHHYSKSRPSWLLIHKCIQCTLYVLLNYRVDIRPKFVWCLFLTYSK